MARLVLPILASAALALPGLFYLGRVVIVEKDSRGTAANEIRINVDFGVLRQGESAEHRCWLRNQTQNPIEVSRFKSSCECVSVSSEADSIAPGERALLTVSFDGTHDAEFTGSLGVTVVVEGSHGESIGHITADVEVIGVAEGETSIGSKFWNRSITTGAETSSISHIVHSQE